MDHKKLGMRLKECLFFVALEEEIIKAELQGVSIIIETD